MFLKVLMDNNTFIDDYALGEPGLCFYIEDDDKKILFDTGYSGAIINNAQHYGLSLSDLDYIVLSHGHNDHSRGLGFLLEHYDLSNVILLAHPDAFNQKRNEGLGIGLSLPGEYLQEKMKVVATREPYQVTDKLIYLGEIPRLNDFENKISFGQELRGECWFDDYLIDDSALVYFGSKATVITGCSHSGICNICEHAKRVVKGEVERVIGGFHIFDVNEQLDKTIDYFMSNGIDKLYPSHCVSFKAKAHINSRIAIEEVATGTELRL